MLGIAESCRVESDEMMIVVIGGQETRRRVDHVEEDPRCGYLIEIPRLREGEVIDWVVGDPRPHIRREAT
jgi:hypothetical protein